MGIIFLKVATIFWLQFVHFEGTYFFKRRELAGARRPAFFFSSLFFFETLKPLSSGKKRLLDVF